MSVSLLGWADEPSLASQAKPDEQARLGLARLQEGDGQGAIVSFQKAIDHNPEDASLHFNLALALQRLGQYRESISPLKRALALEPDNKWEAHELLGTAYAMLGDSANAIAALEVAARGPSPSMGALYALAVASLKVGDDEKAEKTFDRIFTEYADSPEVYLLLGMMHRDHGRAAEALEAQQHALELDPRAPLAHYELGLTKAQMGEWEEARDAFLKEIELHPEGFQAHLALAEYYLTYGRDPDAALKSSNEVLRLRPKSWEAYLHRGKAYLQKGEPEPAMQALEQAVKLRPEQARLHNLLGNAYRRLGRREAAREEFATAARLQNEARARVQSKVLGGAQAKQP
ncbi:MAG: tetratricopeptide repeat protein [Terriglobia bacterium]